MSGRIRCAIYTRKSSEEGLEQSFNSLDAQREACEAFILSQRHEGWQALAAKYDDGGFSGGSMERPALKRLMVDIESGKVNTVVVYKVDRLTRSLADFAKIIELFDSKHVSFVSVTQQFNTTTSMGRLTLNVLLSFAQFEREVTGERIRDKIAASKQKGMWMGGPVPLGYDLRERKLYINVDEAERIREIYCQYLRLGCVSALKEHLDQGPIRSKTRVTDSKWTGGGQFSRGALYKILRNHIYVGEIFHKGKAYPGEHKAIIDSEHWEKVQAMLAENRQGNRRKARATKVSLLTGLVFDQNGNRFTPTHANKSGKRYRYYTSQAVIRNAESRAEITRIPAHDLEVAVTDRVLEFLQSPEEILGALEASGIKVRSIDPLLEQARRKALDWQTSSLKDQETFVKTMIHRVVIRSKSVETHLNVSTLLQALQENPTNAHQLNRGMSDSQAPQIFTLSSPFQLSRYGNELRLIFGNDQAEPTRSNTAIIRAIARARLWYDEIASGEVTGVPDLGRRHGVTPRYVKNIFRCASVGPATVEAILNNEVRPELTLQDLLNELPIEWERQSRLLRGGVGR
jgi:DNA invertase Pin-like site-specific DNA recombinase